MNKGQVLAALHVQRSRLHLDASSLATTALVRFSEDRVKAAQLYDQAYAKLVEAGRLMTQVHVLVDDAGSNDMNAELSVWCARAASRPVPQGLMNWVTREVETDWTDARKIARDMARSANRDYEYSAPLPRTTRTAPRNRSCRV